MQQTMIVTGGSSGIGYALAERGLAEGMAVAICGSQPRVLEAGERLREGGGKVLACVTDVADEQAMDRFRDAVFAWTDAVNLLCCNAGVTKMRPLAEVSLAEFNGIVATNLGGTFNTLRAFVPRMMEVPGPRHVLYTGSMASLCSPMGELAAYGASKMGCLSLSETMAKQYPPEQLGQTFAFIGTTATGMAAQADDSNAEAMRERARQRGVTISTPAEVAALMLGAVREGRRYVVSDPARIGEVEPLHQAWVDAFRAPSPPS